MPAARSTLAATRDSQQNVFSDYKLHSNAARNDSKTTFLTHIRSAYPDYHVTEVDEYKVSLREFAAAGQAELVLDTEDDAFYATREWHAVGEGIEKDKNPGDLKDEFRFARFQYVWEDKEYLIYYITYQNLFEAPTQLFYILYPRSSSSSSSNVCSDGGHCHETDALILAAGKWTSQLHDEIFVFDDGDWVKSKDLYKAVASSSWEDVILAPETKKSLIEDVHGFFDNRELYAQFSVPWKRGIILHGVPGNGKTVSIKALMSSLYQRETAIPSLYVKSFETNCNTEQYAIRAIFQRARNMAPCLLIFEDLDSLVHDDIRSYFLNEVDGLESNDGILMIGSTNHLDKLDPAIAKRPSRFDRKYHFKIPGEEERKGYAEYWRAKLVKNEGVEFPDEVVGLVADLTEGFSFAYMKELFVMSLLCLVRGWEPEQDKGEEDTEEAEAEQDAEEEKKEEICVCKPLCSTCSKPLPSASGDSEADKKADEEKEAEKEVKENKLVLKEVVVPEHLKGNLLLRVIQHQIKVLHAEMDNSMDEEKGDDKAESGSGKRRRGRGRGRRF